jgi:hypothetical protein
MTVRTMKIRKPFAVLFLSTAAVFFGSCGKYQSRVYTGRPFSDSAAHHGPQVIPGRIQCEYYDFGGEGIAYHDADSTNSGSGGLNPADGSYLNEFRRNESVDISYTKMDGRGIDDNPYNRVRPEKDRLYVGWTEPGEWVRYTVRVKESGLYRIGLMFTSNRGGVISVGVDGRGGSGPIEIPSTFDPKEPVPWRQWHHWNRLEFDAVIALRKGIHVLTLSTLAKGNMNYDFLEFSLVRSLQRRNPVP